MEVLDDGDCYLLSVAGGVFTVGKADSWDGGFFFRLDPVHIPMRQFKKGLRLVEVPAILKRFDIVGRFQHLQHRLYFKGFCL